MPKVHDIINSLPGSNALRGRELISEFQSTIRQINEGNKYNSRIDLDSAGVGRVYDDLQQGLMLAEKYDNSAKIAKSKLDTQKDKLNDLMAVINRFKEETSQTKKETEGGSSLPEIRAVADKALKDLETILNSNVRGEYVFGGKNARLLPMTTALTGQTNIVDGRVTTNYTNTNSIEIKARVSHKHEVDLGLVDATNPAIAKFIAAINQYKSSDGKNRAEVDKLMQQATREFEQLQVKVKTEAENVGQALLENTRSTANYTERVKEISAADVVSLSNAAISNIQAILVGFSLESALNNVRGKIFNN